VKGARASMSWLEHERYCEAIVAETALMRETARGADPTRTVPSCPDWTLRDLLVHVGQAHRWAETMVRLRVSEELPDDAEHVPAYDPPPGPDDLDGWLDEGARLLAATLREAGPDLPVWSWARPQRSGFWARRMTHETLVHRADAALGAQRPFVAAAELTADTVDEWLDLITDPEQIAGDKELTELLGTGQTLHLHATDTAAEWVIVRGPERLEVRHEHTKADVALRGTLTDLVLALMRRLPLDSERLEILGDRALLDHWLARTSFG